MVDLLIFEHIGILEISLENCKIELFSSKY